MIDVTQASMVLVGLTLLSGIAILVGSLAFFGVFVQRQYPPEAAKGEERAEDTRLLTRRTAAYRLGFLVLIGLAVLTVLEYLIAVSLPSVIILLVIGLFKAGLIVQFFMHVTRVWSEEAH